MSNTSNNTSPALETSRPDYEIARDELNALFQSLGLKSEISGLHAAVGELGNSKGWAHVAMIVTISRPERRTNNSADYRPAVSVAFPWKMGVGLVDWKAILARTHVSSDDYPRIKAMIGHGSLRPEAQVALCAKHLPAFAKAVNPAEVLANACRDGFDASTQSFEDWAGNYGFDTDSRKAHETYLDCQKSGTQAHKLVHYKTFEKLAELANRL